MVATVNISNGYIVEGSNGSTSSLLVFTLTLSEPLPSSQIIKYATFNGTATGGSSNTTDYGSTTSSVTFAPGELVKTISIQIFNDNISELDEAFYLNVFIPTGSYLHTLLRFEDPTIPNVDILAGTGTGIISDTLISGDNQTLSATVENLTLTGTGNFTGIGNSLNNVITGNSGANQLEGGAGNDTLVHRTANNSDYLDQ
jgi:Ca2+-binding RTX toxin-like protein